WHADEAVGTSSAKKFCHLETPQLKCQRAPFEARTFKNPPTVEPSNPERLLLSPVRRRSFAPRRVTARNLRLRRPRHAGSIHPPTVEPFCRESLLSSTLQRRSLARRDVPRSMSACASLRTLRRCDAAPPGRRLRCDSARPVCRGCCSRGTSPSSAPRRA